MEWKRIGKGGKEVKQGGRANDMTPEAYDAYFKDYPADTRRAEYRARKGVELLGNVRGKALCIGVGNLGEARIVKNAGFDVDICDISPLAVEMAKNRGFTAFICDITTVRLNFSEIGTMPIISISYAKK